MKRSVARETQTRRSARMGIDYAATLIDVQAPGIRGAGYPEHRHVYRPRHLLGAGDASDDPGLRRKENITSLVLHPFHLKAKETGAIFQTHLREYLRVC